METGRVYQDNCLHCKLRRPRQWKQQQKQNGVRVESVRKKLGESDGGRRKGH